MGVAEAVDDSVVEAVDTQVGVIKTAIKNTTVKKAARKKRAGYGDENIEPPTVTRTSSRRRVISKTHSDSALETPATSSRSRAQVLETPANNRFRHRWSPQSLTQPSSVGLSPVLQRLARCLCHSRGLLSHLLSVLGPRPARN